MSENEPIAVQGHFPLYTTEEAANSASPVGTSHTHTFDEVTYYMPDGLIDGETFWHGNYTGNDSDPVESVPSNDRIKISELTDGGLAQLNDEFIVSRGNESFKISLDDIIQAVIDDARLQVPPSNDTLPDSNTSGTASSTSNTASTSTGGLIDAVMTSDSAKTPSHRYIGFNQHTQTVVIVVSDNPNTLKAVPVIDSASRPNEALKITTINNPSVNTGPRANTDYYIWIRPDGQVYQDVSTGAGVVGGYGNLPVGLLRFTKGSV